MTSTQINITPFFKMMAEIVKPFMSHVYLGGANLDGCRVLSAGSSYKSGDHIKRVRKNHVLFSFMAKGDNVVDVEMDMKALTLKPREYIENTIDGINKALQQMQKESRLIVVQKRPLSTAVLSLPH